MLKAIFFLKKKMVKVTTMKTKRELDRIKSKVAHL
jgi:hypothetical protein